MEWHAVSTQAEFDAAIAERKPYIELTAAIAVEIKVPDGFAPSIKGAIGSLIRLLAGSVEAMGSSSVEARGSSSVVARESSSVVAWGSSSVEAMGSSSVEAWGSSSVEARGSSSVVARESSSVEARGSSSVVAWGAAAISLFGKLVIAKASAMVGVHLHRDAKCNGGVQIKVTKPTNAREWCEFYGAEIIDDDAVLFKGLNDKFCSPKGATYKPGTETVAPDWDGGDVECGQGLHFSPCAGMTLEFNSEAEKFVACRVPLNVLAIHPDGSFPHKVKAERCWNWYECDRHGTQIGERYEPLTAASHAT